jgi:hypothetical protein
MPHGFIRGISKIAKNDHYLRRVCPSVRMVQLGFHWTDFHEILYEDFSKICQENSKFNVLLTVHLALIPVK